MAGFYGFPLLVAQCWFWRFDLIIIIILPYIFVKELVIFDLYSGILETTW